MQGGGNGVGWGSSASRDLFFRVIPGLVFTGQSPPVEHSQHACFAIREVPPSPFGRRAQSISSAFIDHDQPEAVAGASEIQEHQTGQERQPLRRAAATVVADSRRSARWIEAKTGAKLAKNENCGMVGERESRGNELDL